MQKQKEKDNMRKDYLFLDIAKRVAEESTCTRVKVGGVLVKDRRIVSTGWNGVPSGQRHCCEVFNEQDIVKENFSDIHREFSEKNEIHCEANIIGIAAKNGIATEGCILYLTVSPCSQCAKLIIASGIREVIYIEEYDRDTNGLELLKKAGVSTRMLKCK